MMKLNKIVSVRQQQPQKKKTKKRKIFYDEIKQDSFGKTCH